MFLNISQKIHKYLKIKLYTIINCVTINVFGAFDSEHRVRGTVSD